MSSEEKAPTSRRGSIRGLGSLNLDKLIVIDRATVLYVRRHTTAGAVEMENVTNFPTPTEARSIGKPYRTADLLAINRFSGFFATPEPFFVSPRVLLEPFILTLNQPGHILLL